MTGTFFIQYLTKIIYTSKHMSILLYISSHLPWVLYPFWVTQFTKMANKQDSLQVLQGSEIEKRRTEIQSEKWGQKKDKVLRQLIVGYKT